MKQVIPFSGAQNSDANPKNMPLGEHKTLSMMEDGRYYGRGGSLVCKRGTSDIGSILIEGEIVIGTAEWVERNRIVYLVYSDERDHFVAFYDFTTQSHTKLIFIRSATLDPDYPISHAEIIDGVLFWTDGKFDGFYNNGVPLYNPPFRLNLERAELGEYGSSADLQTIDVIKYPSPFSPTWIYQSFPALNYNYLRGKLFQFRIQYVYEDGEESAWSPISRLNLPTSGGFINNGDEPVADQNVLRIEFNTGHFTATQIKIAVSVNQGQFGIFKTLDKAIDSIPSDSTYVLDYTGDTSYQSVELDTRNYDNVPLSAVCMSKLVNEISYTNIIRGYDRLSPNIDIAYPITELEGYKINVHQLSVAATLTLVTMSWTRANGSESLQVQEGDYYSFQLILNNSISDFNITLAYSVSETDITDIYAAATPQVGRDILMQRMGDSFITIINSFVTIPATGAMVGSTYQITVDISNAVDVSGLPINGFRPFRLQNTERTLKKGGKYKWYIQYYDRGNRDGTALTSNAMESRVPFVTDQDLSSLSYGGAPYKVNARMTINHYPPSWATHYQILVAKDNGITDFQQTTITYAQVLDDGNYRFTLQNTYEAANRGAVINHQIKKGDRVRFMCSGIEKADSPTPVDYLQDYFECEVLEFQAGEGIDNAPAIYVQRFDFSLIKWNSQSAIQIEIYTPSLDSDVERIFEIGEEYPIINAHLDNRYHGGNFQDQSAVQPAIIDLDYGDAYIRTRMLGTGYLYPDQAYYFYCEDYNYSDFFKSDYNSRGRVAIENVNTKTDRLNLSIHGGKYLRANNTSDINNICRFEFGDNTQEYDAQFGFVTRTITDGKTLKVLQPQKETSVYLNGTYSVNADGGVSAPAFSNKVFGGFRPYDTLFGCSDARMAILVPRMGVFYFDTNSEEFIYSLNNGQKRVSLEASFLTKSKEIAYICRGTRFYCWAFAETQLGKVGINFRSDNGFVTITFSYDTLRFGCDHVSRSVSAYENLGDKLIAFDSDLNTYLYNQDGETEFHNAEFNCDVDVFCNDNLIQPKVFKNVQYQGIKPFDLLCSIEANDTYAYQETEMPTTIQETLEGSHFVQVRNNKFTGTVKTQPYYMVNGRPMRGNYMQVKLSQAPVDGETFPELSVAIVEYFPSEVINA